VHIPKKPTTPAKPQEPIPEIPPDPSQSLMTRSGVIEEDQLQSSTHQYLESMGLLPEDFDAEFGLLAPEDSVIIRPFGGEDDDILLQELRPRFVVLYEPNLGFVRRLEVRKIPTCLGSS